MRLNWKELKPILETADDESNQYLSLIDDEGTILLANASMKREMNLENPRQVKKNFFDLLHPIHKESFRNAFQNSMTNRDPYFMELFMNNGANHAVKWQVNYLPAASGNCKQFICRGTRVYKLDEDARTFIGETGIKSIEEKLQLALDKATLLSNITSDAIWEWDMLSGVMTRNQKMIELTGYLPEHQHGLSWWLSLVHPEDRELVTDTLKEVTDKSLQSWQADYRFLCADGEYKEMHDRGFVIHHNGMPVKMIGSLHDVTDRKLMQTLLLEERLHQYRIISENTLRVQEQERSRFGRELHDNVNQILSAIRLYVGMLTPANVEEKEIKQKVIEYSLLAIEEIRKLSREMITPQLDDGLLVDNIKRIITDVEMTSGIKVKFTYDQDIGLLSPGKKLALFRIIQEQVRNIIKYSKATQVEILLQCSHEIALLIIKDNGVGFDFKKIKSGVGLLSMLERAKFYNGVTEIQSAPGNGTTVITRIPVIKNSTASLNKKMPL